MRQGQPYGAQLQQAGSLRIEHAPRNIDMRDSITVEQDIAVLKVVKKENRDTSTARPATRATLRSGAAAALVASLIDSALCHRLTAIV